MSSFDASADFILEHRTRKIDRLTARDGSDLLRQGDAWRDEVALAEARACLTGPCLYLEALQGLATLAWQLLLTVLPVAGVLGVLAALAC